MSKSANTDSDCEEIQSCHRSQMSTNFHQLGHQDSPLPCTSTARAGGTAGPASKVNTNAAAPYKNTGNSELEDADVDGPGLPKRKCTVQRNISSFLDSVSVSATETLSALG